jgi:hypothetical protein
VSLLVRSTLTSAGRTAAYKLLNERESQPKSMGRLVGARMNYLDGFERLKPDPGDSHELLLNKASRLIDHYFQLHNLSVPPSHTSLDVARHLESLNTATPAGLGADPALNLLL